MSTWTIFAICFTTLLLGAGSAFTLLAFFRADRKMRAAESKALAQRAGARTHVGTK